MPPKRPREIIRYEFIEGAEVEKTKRSRIKAGSLSKTQIWLGGNTLIGLGLLIWDRVDEGFTAPNLFGASLPALMLILPLIGLLGRATVTAVVEGAAKIRGK